MSASSGKPGQPARAAVTVPGTGAYVIRPGEIKPGWVMLYAGTFALQLFCAAARATVTYPILWVAFKLLGQPTAHVHDLSILAGYGPLALSLATLILPLGGWWWEQQAGGRSPSERERLVFEDAIATLSHADPALRPPRRWFVLDVYDRNAAVYADTLMITRGLLESGYLEAVLAHELGHLNSSDSRLTAALHRLTTPPRKRVRRGLRTITLLATGGLAVWVTRAPWGVYWRAREHQADQYAASLGQAQGLARFLETNALDEDLPVPFIWLTDTSHPPVEHRIDRLDQQQNPISPA
jgi:Zn-dependent protease with chaperone function